jgi:hypothetical protein
METSHPFTLEELFAFVDLAGQSTYASGQPPQTTAQRPDFIEYEFSQDDWQYLDSYTGHSRSVGQEVVRFKGEIVWANSYCGGMLSGYEAQASDTFAFLKQALSAAESSFQSLRGPAHFELGVWQYRYHQDGKIDNFVGLEEILLQGKVVFFHRAIGGLVVNT